MGGVIYQSVLSVSCFSRPSTTVKSNILILKLTPDNSDPSIYKCLIGFPPFRRIPISESYTLSGLYPNTLYYVWLAARSQRGEGANTPPVPVRTKQYGKDHHNLHWRLRSEPWNTQSILNKHNTRNHNTVFSILGIDCIAINKKQKYSSLF